MSFWAQSLKSLFLIVFRLKERSPARFYIKVPRTANHYLSVIAENNVLESPEAWLLQWHAIGALSASSFIVISNICPEPSKEHFMNES